MPLDRHTPEVGAFIRDIEEWIEQKRNGLERKDKSYEDTLFLRGEIKAYRQVISKLTDTGDDDE